MQLRPYQTEAIQLLRKGFLKHQRQVLCLATGSGKTLVFSEMVRLAALKNTSCLILTDRIELFRQTFATLSCHNMPVQEITAETKQISPQALVSVAMVETIHRRISSGLALNPKLIIADECHKSSFNKIIDAFPACRVIGATATPVGKHLYKYYTNIVNNIDVPQLVNEGFLAPCRAFQMQDDFSAVQLRNGEFREDQLFNHFNKSSRYHGVIEQYQRRLADPAGPGKKTIVFCVNIKHSETTYEAFRQLAPSYLITSKTPMRERHRSLAAYASSPGGVMINCGCLTTGIDIPSIEAAIIDRATMSLPLFLQMCGRCSRPHPNKQYFIILDFGMNHDRHGMWNEPRLWSLDPPKKRTKRPADMTKKCPRCEEETPAGILQCPACGFAFPKPAEPALKNGVLAEVSAPVSLSGKSISRLSTVELLALERSKRYKPAFIWRILRSKGENAILEYAERKKYSRGWIYRQRMLAKDRRQTQYNDFIIR